MSNTTELYNAMKKYTDTLLDAHAEYMATMAKYATAKGSQFYVDIQADARKKRQAATEVIREETIAQVNAAIDKMMTKAATRKAVPLTPDQMTICQAMKLRDKVTLDELLAAGNAMDGNLSGLAILQEVAHKSGVVHNFIADARGLSGPTLTGCIRQMREKCYGIINSDGATRATTLAAQFHARHYGNGVANTDTLPRIDRFESEENFLARMMATGVSAADFADAVN